MLPPSLSRCPSEQLTRTNKAVMLKETAESIDKLINESAKGKTMERILRS